MGDVRSLHEWHMLPRAGQLCIHGLENGCFPRAGQKGGSNTGWDKNHLEWEKRLETKKSTTIQHERTCKNIDKCSIVQIAFLNLFGIDVYTV